MTINASPINTKDQGAIYDHLDSKSNIQWLNCKLHDSGDNDIAVVEDMHGSPLVTTGTTTHQYDTLGWWLGTDGTPAGDRYYRDEVGVTSLDNLCRLDNHTTGSLLIVVDFWASVLAPSATEYLMTWGRKQTNQHGHIGVYNDASGNVKCTINTKENSTGITETCLAAGLSTSTRHTFGFLVDINNAILSCYLDDEADVHTTPGDISGLIAQTMPDPTTGYGLTLAANGNSGVGIALHYGTDAGRECRMSELLIIKDTSTALAAQARVITTGMYNNKGDLPEALLNL